MNKIRPHLADWENVAVKNVFKWLIHKKTARNQKRYQKPCVKIVEYYELLIHPQKYIQRQKK